MKTNRLRKLSTFGQSIWLDYIRRDLIVNGQLRLEWTYSENVHRRSTIENLAEAYAEELRSIISHCLSSEVYATAGDFDWGEGEMEEIASAISRSRGK